MKEFKSFSDFSKHIDKVATQYDEKENRTLHYLGEYLAEDMKNTIGHLQQGAGPFESWKPLAASTVYEKKRLGYAFNEETNPLLRTGDLRMSIIPSVEGHSLYVGSTDDVMIYQELGTTYIPPRSVLGLTMYKQKQEIVFVLKQFIKNWILGSQKSFLNLPPIRKSS